MTSIWIIRSRVETGFSHSFAASVHRPRQCDHIVVACIGAKPSLQYDHIMNINDQTTRGDATLARTVRTIEAPPVSIQRQRRLSGGADRLYASAQRGAGSKTMLRHRPWPDIVGMNSIGRDQPVSTKAHVMTENAVRREHEFVSTPSARTLHAELMLLCARIGYSPPVSI